MKTDSPPLYHANPDLRQLVDGALAGTLGREEMARLEHFLESDPGAMEWYLSMAELEALLPLAAKKASAKLARRVDTLELARQAHSRWHWWPAAAAAAAVVLGVLVWRPWKAPGSGKPFATITASMGVKWSSAGALRLDEDLYQQKVEPSTGLVEITHASGTRVLIEGPASYTVVGPNAGKLDFGRLVATVPPAAKGFTVDTGNEKVVDHGTEFAIALPRGGRAEVGVFRGEVELTSLDGKQQLAKLFTDHAVSRETDSGTGVTSIPFDRSKFIRTLPTRELNWDIKGVKPGSLHTFEFDVTGLVWEAGEYRAIFKWMEGRDALDIEEVTLRRDGQEVASDVHHGSTGILRHVNSNIYRLKLPASNTMTEGRWTLSVSCRPWIAKTSPPPVVADSRGIVLFESGLALSAREDDFIGRWEYSHDGILYVREFKADGSATLLRDGKPYPSFEGSTWQCRDGVLRLNLTQDGLIEDHILRDDRTLLFVDRPYRNARRVEY